MAAVWSRSLTEPVYWIFFLGLELAAIMTAAYIGRLCFLTFGDAPRSDAAERAHESPLVMTVPLAVLAGFTVVLGLFGTQLVGVNLFNSLVNVDMARKYGGSYAAHRCPRRARL